MSDVESSKPDARHDAANRKLDSDDRAWLDDRLEEYRELLTYLHDH